jgi:hypothetical protein
MSQAPSIPVGDAHKKQAAIETIRSLSPEDKKDAAQQLGLKPGRQATDMIWMTIVTSFALILLGSFIALAVAVLIYGKLSGELLLTVFTTSAAFLAGLLAPSPTQAKPS